MTASGRRRIAVVTADPVTAQMPGPAIRAWHIADELSADSEVRLVSTVRAGRSSERFRVELASTAAEIEALVEWCEVLVFQGGLLTDHPFLVESDRVLVCDIYDPFHLENLEQTREQPPAARDATIAHLTGVLNTQLRRGDLFLCASDKQRDFWLGSLAALGRVNPATYDDDPNLDALIKVAPFGLPATPPVTASHPIRDGFAGIGSDDPVILWAGGVYSWFDPLTLVRAIAGLRHRRPDVRLVFLAMHHPNPHIPPMPIVGELRRLSDELGLTGVHVFFNEAWVPYDDRAAWLLDANVGVSTHLAHIETAFSFRTRILDYLWAGLPIVSTGGDAFASLIERTGIGAVVPPGDVAALEAALESVIAAPPEQASVRAVGAQFTWERALEPLVSFCRHPRRAPDLVARPEPAAQGVAARLRHAYGEGGLALVAERALRLGAERLEERRSRHTG